MAPFEVRVNRILLLGMAAIGALFFFVGLDAAFFRSILDWNVSPENQTMFKLFLFFAVGIGGLITINCLWYMLFPPVMMRFDQEGIWIGTGLRYSLQKLPWTRVKTVGYGAGISVTTPQQLFAGMMITFEEGPDIPPHLVTSAGISYAFHMLTIHWAFADRFPWTIIEAAKQFQTRAGKPS